MNGVHNKKEHEVIIIMNWKTKATYLVGWVREGGGDNLRSALSAPSELNRNAITGFTCEQEGEIQGALD